MTERTEAQRLAGELEDESKSDPDDYRWKSAAELLRLDAENAALRDALPDLSPVINWLENGCDPKNAAKELRLYAEVIRAALSGTAPAPKLICKMCGADRFAEPCQGNGVRCGITGDAA